MAKYDITHACGHTETVQLYGPNKERDRKIAWLEEQGCPDCRRAAKVEAAKAKGLTEGTDKQIAWAADLLAEVKTDDNLILAALLKMATPEQIEALRALGAEGRTRLEAAKAEALAAQWTRTAHDVIERRADLIADVSKAAAEALIRSL